MTDTELLAPSPDAVASRRRKLATAAVCAFVLALVAGTAWLTIQYVIPDEKQDVQTQTIDDASAILAAKNAIVGHWPAAVSTFGKVFVHAEGSDIAVCGMVDLQEQDDSFAGMERFTYIDGQITIEQDDGTAAVIAKWNDICQ